MIKKKFARALKMFFGWTNRLDQILGLVVFFTCDGSSTIRILPLLFKNMYGNFTKIKFSYKVGGQAPLVEEKKSIAIM